MRIILNFMKYDTVKKKRLLSFFSNNKDKSFSVHMLESSLPDIAISTLYRLLDGLCQDGEIKRCSSSGRSVLYQYNDKKCPHHMHIRCTSCGRIEHLSSEDSEKIDSLIKSKLDFNVSNNSTLEGICKECLKTE